MRFTLKVGTISVLLVSDKDFQQKQLDIIDITLINSLRKELDLDSKTLLIWLVLVGQIQYRLRKIGFLQFQ